MRRITFHEDAEAEMTEASRHYESRATGLGHAFLDEVDHAATAVADKPEAFQLVAREIRHKLLARFPYSLFYVIEPNRIRVLAVAHHKRRPEYWMRRA